MKLNRYDKVMTFLCVILLPFFIGILIGQKHPHKLPVEPTKERIDTLLVRDTIVANTPVFVERVRVDSVLVPVHDTLRLQDTLYVYLERDHIRWDDDYCSVWASGIRPQIDSVAHYINERIIYHDRIVPVKAPTRWGLGIHAGMGACKDGLTPYIGVGVSYNFLSW